MGKRNSMKMRIYSIFVVTCLSSPIEEQTIPNDLAETNLVDLGRLFAASIKLVDYGGEALVEAHTQKAVTVLSKQSSGIAEVVTSADLESNKRMSFSFPKLFPNIHV